MLIVPLPSSSCPPPSILFPPSLRAGEICHSPPTLLLVNPRGQQQQRWSGFTRLHVVISVSISTEVVSHFLIEILMHSMPQSNMSKSLQLLPESSVICGLSVISIDRSRSLFGSLFENAVRATSTHAHVPRLSDNPSPLQPR